MNMTQILDTIKRLAQSQGFYQRLYDRIMNLKENDPKTFEDYKNLLESQKFKDEIDVILHFEDMPKFTVKSL